MFKIKQDESFSIFCTDCGYDIGSITRWVTRGDWTAISRSKKKRCSFSNEWMDTFTHKATAIKAVKDLHLELVHEIKN